MSGSNTIRLDLAVLGKVDNISRSSATKLIEAGRVKVNGQIIQKASLKVSPSDKIKIDSVIKLTVPKIDLKILYEDQDVIVINKPIGLLSHSKGSFNPEATVASWLKPKYVGPISERSGIVHRLDRATSGVMIVAKNEAASKWLQKQFSTRKVKKTYVAIVSGHLKHKQAVIDLPIERNPKNPQLFRVGASGRPAVTAYEVLSYNDKYSEVELKPVTGRTHQIRIHLAYLGHPIVGDHLYGGTSAERLYLHAKSLELTLPSSERRVFMSELPKEFKILVSNEIPATKS